MFDMPMPRAGAPDLPPAGPAAGSKPAPWSRTVNTSSEPVVVRSDRHRSRPGVARHVRERLLGDAKHRLPGSRVQRRVRRQHAELEAHLRPPVLAPGPGIACGIRATRPALASGAAYELLQHRFHLRHRVARGEWRLFERLGRSIGVGAEARLSRRGGRLNDEQLLFDRR